MSVSNYLNVVNTVLVELNEVKLTSSNFSSAVGIQEHIKGAVNRALFDINQKNYKWPFLSTGSSTEPHLGNAVITCVAGQRWYDIKSGSSGVDNDYGFVDWETFSITNNGTTSEVAPFFTRRLLPESLSEWTRRYASQEAMDASNTQVYGIPVRYIKSRNGRQIGLSPLPDKDYKIYFFAWDQMDKVTAYDDTFPFQEQYVHTVLLPRVRYYGWLYKENESQWRDSKKEYEEGMRRMREILKEDRPVKEFRDDRIRVI